MKHLHLSLGVLASTGLAYQGFGASAAILLGTTLILTLLKQGWDEHVQHISTEQRTIEAIEALSSIKLLQEQVTALKETVGHLELSNRRIR